MGRILAPCCSAEPSHRTFIADVQVREGGLPARLERIILDRAVAIVSGHFSLSEIPRAFIFPGTGVESTASIEVRAYLIPDSFGEVSASDVLTIPHSSLLPRGTVRLEVRSFQFLHEQRILSSDGHLHRDFHVHDLDD